MQKGEWNEVESLMNHFDLLMIIDRLSGIEKDNSANYGQLINIITKIREPQLKEINP